MVSGTKLPNYTAPVYPFLAIIIGWYFGAGDSHLFIRPSYLASLLITLMPIGLFVAHHFLEIKEINSIPLWFIGPSIIGLISIVLAVSKKWERAWTTANLGYITFSIVLFITALPAIDQGNPVLNSEWIWKGSERVFYFKDFNPAFVFNIQKEVPDVEAYINQLRSGDLILTNNKNLLNIKRLGIETTQIFEGDDLFESTATFILRVD
jgi:hypothetical protein